jgi:hypothetical protein
MRLLDSSFLWIEKASIFPKGGDGGGEWCCRDESDGWKWTLGDLLVAGLSAAG